MLEFVEQRILAISPSMRLVTNALKMHIAHQRNLYAMMSRHIPVLYVKIQIQIATKMEVVEKVSMLVNPFVMLVKIQAMANLGNGAYSVKTVLLKTQKI